jgi:hypothetical protein
MQRREKRIILCLAHMSGNEMKYIQEAFDTNWVVPLGPNVNAFEDELKHFVTSKPSVPFIGPASLIRLVSTPMTLTPILCGRTATRTWLASRSWHWPPVPLLSIWL